MKIWIIFGLFGLLSTVAPVSAQRVVWSATMTPGLHESPEASLVGYHPGLDIGSIDTLEFEFVGKLYTIDTLIQRLSGSQIPPDDVGSISLRFNPGVLPHSDLETMGLLVDGEPLEVEYYSYSGAEENPRGAVIQFVDPSSLW